MDWKKWIASRVSGQPTSVGWLPKCFPILVALYGVTKLEADGSSIGTKQITFMNMTVAVGELITLCWERGLTVPSAQLPQATAVDAGSIAFAARDILALRKQEVPWPLLDPVTKTATVKNRPVYAFYVQEGDGLLVIEIMDLQESLDGEQVSVTLPVVKA